MATTRLGLYGGPRFPYGSFAGKEEKAGGGSSSPGGGLDFGPVRRTFLTRDPGQREMVLPKAFYRVPAPFAIGRPPLLLLPRAFALVAPPIGVGSLSWAVLPAAHETVPEPFAEGTGRRVYDQEAGMARLLELAEDMATRQKPNPTLLMAYRTWERKNKGEGEPTLREIAQEMAASGDPSILRAMRRR